MLQRFSLNRAIIAILIVLIILPVSAFSKQVNTRKMVENIYFYFDLLVSGNLESARNLWTESVIERSERFGIEYDSIPLKLDCSSPVMQDLSGMRDNLFHSIRQVMNLKGDEYFTAEYSVLVDSQKVTHLYYSYYDGDYFWLTYPQDYYAHDWPVMESRYFRIHYHPDREVYLNQVTLDEADNFVKITAKSLGLSKTDLNNIKEKKIEYFYCPSDSVVEKIIGTRTRGMLDLPTNDIISAYFPHFHAVSHLLMNIRLKHLPLYTQPLLSEGLAVYLGGRWGKSSATLDYLAGFLQDQKFVEVDSIITKNHFERHSTADMSYPVAGLFTTYLIDALGIDKYLELYLSLSGSRDEIFQMKTADVKKVICDSLEEQSWSDVMQKYMAFSKRRLEEDVVFSPGEIEDGEELIDNNGLIVTENDEWISIQIAGDKEQPQSGSLYFGMDKNLVDEHSLLYEEQRNNSEPMTGYRYGIRFDVNETGLYDFATNQLLGKFINSLTPSDAYLSSDGDIAVKFRKELTRQVIPEDGNYELVLEK
ncbi:MAG: hypothetical protein U9N55_05775 [candidate division Zixibacteria bacterium]|nr:hypothetical protein [candidate division Zixibacteria bacterium]